MRRIRQSRSSYRKRRWRPWLLLVLILAAVASIAVLLGCSQSVLPSPGRVVEISTSASGVHRLDGKPVSLGELEASLSVLRSGETPLFVGIASEPWPNGKGAWPSPDVEALLARLKISWMSMPEVALTAMPPKDTGGDHGR